MPDLELNTNLLAELGGWPVLKEARGLVERGKVQDARREGNVIRARVQGAEKVYQPQITLAPRVAQVEVRCTCAESRRSGRVCAHAIAAGLALLQPVRAPTASPTLPASSSAKSAPAPSGPRRWPREEAPAGTPLVECSILLPLQLKEAFSQRALRVILEARRPGVDVAQPWETALRELKDGFALSEEDARLLDALQLTSGALAGINAVPREQLATFLRGAAGHPRLWLGKKQALEVRALLERPKLFLHRRPGGVLELVPDPDLQGSTGTEVAPGWRFDGRALWEAAPSSLAEARLIPRAEIPEFLSRTWPRLEQSYEIVLPPGFEEFVLEKAEPAFAAHLEGTLAGLTLNLMAQYGDRSFGLGGKGDVPDEQAYFADARDLNRFWRRNPRAEREALAQVESAGFSAVRSGASTFSLIRENEVTRFLANTLPRWRQTWRVVLGSRLEETLRQVDIAEAEFTLKRGSGEDWLSLDLQLSVAGKPVPLSQAEIQRWLQTGQNHARTSNQRVLIVPTEAWGEMREVLADCAVDQEPGSMRVPRLNVPFLRGALEAQGFQARDAPSPGAPAPVQNRLEQKLWEQLRPYQRHGVEWLAGLAQQKFSGLLADDMGLGKTLQALAFAAWLRCEQSTPTRPVLVICPTSLVANWLREAARFVPSLRTLDLTGANRSARWPQMSGHDLLVTSYAILRRDFEHYRAFDFSLVILDEAQHIKNRGSQNAQAAKALRSRQRLILTGTPLENSILDLWSLFDFLQPGYLGTAQDFRERYETPLTRGPDPKAMERLRHRVRPFFLRRMKEEVLPELPPKLEYPTLCELSDEQREVYRGILAQGRRDVFDRAGKSGQGRDRIAVLTTLLRLRQVCCHLDLLPSDDPKRAWKEPSAKLDRTFELIDEAIDGGHRVLLFSQFVRVLHLLRDEAKRRELPYAYLDGQTTERQAEVDRFQQNAGIPLFLISLKAGGTGLNLTGADTVIHFDPWWNPAVEEQATARAHRLGQSRRVQSYKLIAAGTVEEKIQALQSRKKELFQASLGGDDAFVESLTGDELEDLLTE